MTEPAGQALASRPFHRAVDRASNAPAIPGNRVTLLIDGPETYDVMLAQIASSAHRIHLEQYIFNDDACGRRFADALIARAEAGITVRVLYDWFGCLGTPRRFWRRLRDAGVEVRAFGAPRVDDPLLMFVRDHRKVLVVDGARGVTGGLCIGDEWLGDESGHHLPWRDTAIAIEGPAARGLDGAFARAWSFAGGAVPDDAAEVGPDVPAMGDTAVRVVATEPGYERTFRAIDLLLAGAQEKVWVTEAYFVALPRIYQGFKDAARDGVDIRVLVPGQSDIRVVRNLTRSGYRGLLSARVRIWEWNGPMLHAKTIVVDGRWTKIGSSNLNPSSLLANWELDVLIDDPHMAGAVERQFLGDIARSSEVVRRPRRVPVLFGRPVPPALARERPSAGPPAAHIRGSRERRRRALVTGASLMQGARAAVFGPLSAVLLVASALFLVFPATMAGLAAALCAAIGAMLLVRAIGHRARS